MSNAVTLLNQKLPSYCTAELSRHGKLCVYFRRVGKTGKIRMRAEPLSAEFFADYAALLGGGAPPSPLPHDQRTMAVPHTWRWLCLRYFQSMSFRSLARRGQGVRRRMLEATWEERVGPTSNLKFGDFPLDSFRPKAIRVLRDRKVGWEKQVTEDGEEVEVRTNTEAANSRLKYIRGVLAFGKEDFPDLVERNWGLDVAYFKSDGGFHTWSLEEVCQFEEVHPVGTKARLAMALGLYTGQRLGDLVRLGRRFERDDLLVLVQEKNRRNKAITAYVPVVPALRGIIDASPTGDLFYLVQENGQPYAKASLGNLFRQWCDEAGLHQCSAHGLRKACVVRLIMEGCSPHQVMAITGHQTLKEVDRYAREFMREQAAVQVLDAWLVKHAADLR